MGYFCQVFEVKIKNSFLNLFIFIISLNVSVYAMFRYIHILSN